MLFFLYKSLLIKKIIIEKKLIMRIFKNSINLAYTYALMLMIWESAFSSILKPNNGQQLKDFQLSDIQRIDGDRYLISNKNYFKPFKGGESILNQLSINMAIINLNQTQNIIPFYDLSCEEVYKVLPTDSNRALIGTAMGLKFMNLTNGKVIWEIARTDVKVGNIVLFEENDLVVSAIPDPFDFEVFEVFSFRYSTGAAVKDVDLGKVSTLKAITPGLVGLPWYSKGKGYGGSGFGGFGGFSLKSNMSSNFSSAFFGLDLIEYIPATHRKGKTNFLYFGDFSAKVFLLDSTIMTDASSSLFYDIGLGDPQYISDITQGNADDLIVIATNTNSAYAVNENTQALQTTISFPGPQNSKIFRMKIISDSDFLLMVVKDTTPILIGKIYAHNLNDASTQLISPVPDGISITAETFGYNSLNGLIATIGGLDSFQINEIDSPYTCSDSDCLQCGFADDHCLRCGGEKKLSNGQCVYHCPEGRYYNSDLNTCFIDLCAGGNIYNYKTKSCIPPCPGDQIFDQDNYGCSTCQQKNPECDSCQDGSLICEGCQEFFINTPAGNCRAMTCQENNPSCLKCKEGTYECEEYRCETKGCTNCPDKANICEEPRVRRLRDFARTFSSINNILDSYINPSGSGIGFIVSVAGGDELGMYAMTSIQRITFSKKFLLLNLDKGEIPIAYLTLESNSTKNSNVIDMKSVSTKFYQYNRTIWLKLSTSIKLSVFFLVTLIAIVMILMKNKKISNKSFCKKLFLVRKAWFSINFSMAIDFSFYVTHILTNLFWTRNWKSIMVWIVCAVSFVIHWGYEIWMYTHAASLKAIRIPCCPKVKRIGRKERRLKKDKEEDDKKNKEEDDDKKNKEEDDDKKNKEEDDDKKNKEEDLFNKNTNLKKEKLNKNTGKKKPAPEPPIDELMTKYAIEQKSFSIIELLRMTHRKSEGFLPSKFLSLLNLLRNQVVLMIIVSLPNYAPTSCFFFMLFEFGYISYLVRMFHIYKCYRYIVFVQNLLNSLNLIISYIIIFHLHYSAKKSFIGQTTLMILNIFYTFTEYCLLVSNIVVKVIEKRKFDKEKEKLIQRKYKYIVQVIFFIYIREKIILLEKF